MSGMDERNLEHMLKRTLTKAPPLPTDVCLDAETLAAFADGGLSGSALELATGHLADCARCQAAAAVLARSAADPAPAAAQPRRWLTWLVPLTAAATVAAIWVAVPRDGDAPEAPVAEMQRQSEDARPSAPSSFAAPTSPAELSPGANELKEETAAKAKPDLADQVEPRALESRRDTERREADRLEPSSPQQKALGKVAASSEATGALADGASAAAGDHAAAAPAAPPPPAGPAPAAVARERIQARALNRQADDVALSNVIVSPEASVRWRVAGSIIERSADGGTSWTTVANVPSVQLAAGSAPSPSVCWVVGRQGVVLRSTDGRTFVRVPFPEPIDLAGIAASSADAASVSTADGRTFETRDGGATWGRR